MTTFIQRYLQFRFHPNKHTGFALGTLVLMVALTRLGTLAEGGSVQIAGRTIGTEFFWFVLFVMLGSLFTGVYVPVSHVTKAIGETLHGLGIRRDNLPVALGLSVLISAFYVQPLLAEADGRSSLLVQYLLFNAVFGLWQVIFIHGWLQLRYAAAFGPIPAIILAGLSYVLLNATTLDLLPVLIIGLGQAFAFSVLRSIFILWPIPWAVTYSISALQAGFDVTWGRILLFAGLVVLVWVMLQWVTAEAKREGLLEPQTSS